MQSTTRVVENLDSGIWKAVESLAESRDTSIRTLITEALIRDLDDESDREIAVVAQMEGGWIPYDFGRRLLLAETDEDAAQAEVMIDEHARASER